MSPPNPPSLVGTTVLRKLMRISILFASYVTPAVFFSPPTSLLSHQTPTFPPPSATTRLHLIEGGAPPRRAGRSSSDRPRRPPPNRSAASRSRSSPSAATAGRNRSTSVVERSRAPHQFDHTKADARPFLEDAATFVRQQSPNEDAPCYVFPGDDEDCSDKTKIPEGSHLVSVSLDDLFPNLDFSEKFCSTKEFRHALRNSMREDIFDSTPSYAGMSEKARRMLLLPDSSLQGSWNCRQFLKDADDIRMRRLTLALKEHLGEKAPTGDQFMESIGKLCGSKCSTHWIDIVGITDRKISHSWHQDTGRFPGGDTCRTVMLGFPKEDNYDGVGVFSHAVKLKYERVAPEGHPQNEPIVYPKLEVDDEYIVKPRFAKGCEIVIFRDIDNIHSAPDVAHRASVMRFM